MFYSVYFTKPAYNIMYNTYDLATYNIISSACGTVSTKTTPIVIFGYRSHEDGESEILCVLEPSPASPGKRRMCLVSIRRQCHNLVRSYNILTYNIIGHRTGHEMCNGCRTRIYAVKKNRDVMIIML